MAKQYGLIIPGQQKKPTLESLNRPAVRPKIFDESSDDDEEDNEGRAPLPQQMSKKPNMGPGVMERRMARQIHAKALEEDPTVFQYDELYDEIEQKRVEAKEIKKNEPKKPKYIERLLKYAERRKLEGELRVERQVQKERDAEGEMFKDKETFVTNAYKKKMEELRKLQEQHDRDEYLEAIGDVTKQKDLDGFYRHLYEQKMSTMTEVEKSQIGKPTGEGNEEKQDKQTNLKKPSKSAQRAYRKRRASENSDGDEDQKATTSEENKMHLPNNMDADSDFSIDSSSSSEDEDPEKETKGDVKDTKEEKTTSKLEETDSKMIAMNFNQNKTNDKENKAVDKPEPEPVVEQEQLKLKKPKQDIWKKRTVGDVFDAALQRYYERKAAKGS